MKNIYIVLLLLLGYNISLSGQGALNAVAYHISCPEIATGSFSLTLASSVLEQYDLPFSAEWENLDNGDYEEFQFNSNYYFLTGLAAGNYEIVINLGENCTIEYTGEITSTTNIDLELKGENPTLSSDCSDGFIDLRIDGGVAPYDIVWERLQSIVPLITEVVKVGNGVSGNDGQEDLENARDGSYRVMVTDANCDPVFASTILSCECGEDCEIVGQIMNANCGELGAIRVELSCSGSTVPIKSYEWSDGSEAASLENLMPGNYCVTITDEDDCENEECFTVESGEEDVTVSLLEIKHVTLCNEDEECGEVGCDDDGSLTINVNSNESYMLTWTGPNGFSSNQSMLSNLERGIYSLEVNFEDPSVCDVLETYTIAVCERTWYNSHWDECENLSDYGNYEAGVSIDDITPVSDDNLCGGALDIEITAPYNSFFFRWEGPNGFSSIDEDIDGLCEGEYCLILDNGCSTQEDCFNVVNCDNVEIRVDGEVTNTCPNVDFGSIEVLVEGGEEPYDYQWSSGQTTQNLDRLFEGVYTLTVTDKNGCDAVGEFVVTDEIEIVEEPRPNDMCIQYYSCSGRIVDELTDNIGIAGCEFSEEDCRIEICTCNDGVQLDPIERGLRPLQRDIFNECRLIQLCYNNEEYVPARVQGEYRERTEAKLDDIDESPGAAKTVWFCCNVEGCVFPPGYEEWNVTTEREDGLIISIAGQPGSGVGCTIEGSCNGVTFYNKHFPDETCVEELVPLRGDCNTIEIAPNSVEDPNGGIEFAEVGFDESLLFLKSDKETIISNVYPNPFSKEITVDISSREKQIINYTLLNMDGRILFKDKIQIEKESNSYTINLSKISQKGLLFLVLLDEYGNQFHHKIVKQ